MHFYGSNFVDLILNLVFVLILGCGGLIRDNNGHWKGGFVKCIGRSYVFVVELSGVLLGLKLALQSNMQNIVLQIDSKATVIAIKRNKLRFIFIIDISYI